MTLTPADFEGVWQIDRRITDRLTGAESRLTGQAQITPGDDGWLYHETGKLVLAGGAALSSERRYLWRATAGGIAVFFADGRPFHDFVPGQTGAVAPHHCDPDLYRPQYDFDDWPVWTLRWDVTGPRKDYTSVTTHRRAA